ncbi:MAG: DUF5119 domain-containing protein [Paludibacteraceae bacterium]|nr:DUF5119 domain-containing protein [Paludibacteraceae bacterium]
MKKLILFAALLLIFASCRYKELCYDHNHQPAYNLSLKLNLDLDLDVDLEVSDEAHTKIKVPELMKVCFYAPQSGALIHTAFVGPYGGDIQVPPGSYKMVVYAFDTEWTWIRGESDQNSLEAYTSDITTQKQQMLAHATQSGKYNAPGPIIYTPDHLLVAKKDVEIPVYTLGQQVVTVTATAATIVETYGFEVPNIDGIEYIASVEAFVTNQARSSYFGRGEKSTEAATVSFPLDVNKEKGVLKSTFNTFGKLPGESMSYLHIVVTDAEGNIYTVTDDITDQFDDPDHTIVIEDSVIIPKPETSGGIAPTVEEWENVNTDVPIG